MSCFTVKYSPTIGPVARVGIRAAGFSRPSGAADGTVEWATVEWATVEWVMALYDSGAEKSSILPDVAGRIGLVPVGKVELSSATGVAPVNEYHVDIVIEFDRPGTVDKEEKAIAGIRVAEFDAPGRHFQMLLGRDVLKYGVFQMDGINHSFMFCI